MVFVDHALANLSRRPPATGGAPPPPVAPPPTSPSGGPRLAMGMEDDPNFAKLPPRDRELHLWGTTQTRDQAASPDSLGMLLDCIAQADAISKDQSHPHGDKPLVDVTAGTPPPLPPPVVEKWRMQYEELQTKVLALSEDSKRLVAENSGHFIIIDRPDVVIYAINQVVRSVRIASKL